MLLFSASKKVFGTVLLPVPPDIASTMDATPRIEFK
jgi:hypothetical protein